MRPLEVKIQPRGESAWLDLDHVIYVGEERDGGFGVLTTAGIWLWLKGIPGPFVDQWRP